MSEILDSKGNNVELAKATEKVQTDEKGHLAVIKTSDGVEHKVVNTVSLLEIVIHKLEDDREVSQIIAHEFMMADHKEYMVRHLTDAINTVMRAKRREGMVNLISKAAMHKVFGNRIRSFLNRKKR